MKIISLKGRLAEFFKAVALLHQTMNTVHRLLNDKPVASTHPCAWLAVFSKQELLMLTQDVERAMHHGFFTGDWSSVSVTMRSWYDRSTAKAFKEILNVFSD
jgi:hypothetical protein